LGSKKSGSSEYGLCEAMKRYILELDGYRCAQCGKTTTLNVHHIRYTVPCRKENLITLCEDCHHQLHSYFKDLSKMPKYANERRRRRKRVSLGREES